MAKKQKTKRAAAKRFKLTGSGKFKFQNACKRHILTGRSRKNKMHLKGTTVGSDSDLVHIHRMLPYGSTY